MSAQDPARLLDDTVRFHGHLCPGLAMGYRVALAARDRLGSQRAEDEELVAVVENDSCAVDAVQSVLGCTFGKGNLLFRDHGKHVYTFFRRGQPAPALRIRVRRPSLPNGLSKEERARAVLAAPTEEMLEMAEVEAPIPPPARIEPSHPCSQCGEEAMESRLRLRDGKLLCLPCWRRQREDAAR